ncbi:fibronectin type III domain-containing protein [Amycolatopsis sp. 195334CR]|uniref:fibronectin type III domain-containing protein n=1 Tax=Amycolatopsis sp. 195334CR TaxID=2814588 RepID=UPI001A8C5138|nr:fibronectin type III domain-containing protein [Amycolatopsis sp. 195334CR]MBN6037051.1 fibronectin type III domain-containing protein [Amycolatopsis sp. 195334CR]
MVITVVAVATAVGVAVSGAAKPDGGIDFFQSGHWVFSNLLGTVFHIDGASRNVDAQLALPGADPGSQVVQGETGGYVVGGNRIIEFGKSDLAVEKTISPPADERPVALEVAGGPYLVYRQAGQIVRLGDDTLTVSAGGKLGEPVATTGGDIWLHHTESNAICELARDADRLECPTNAPSGHTGGLTVVADRPVFVDTSTDTVHAIDGKNLGPGTALGVDAPPNARLASTDVGGRIAVLDGPGKRMHLVDTTPAKANPVTVDLPDGDYADVASSGQSVVLLDRAKNNVLTYDRDGNPRKTTPVPPSKPRLSRGEDSRVYVDSDDGGHVLVVDNDGAVNPVDVARERQPTPPPVPVQPQQPPQAQPQQPPQQRTPPPAKPKPPSQPEKPAPPPAKPASPPGAPPGVKATAGNAAVTVNWGAASPNGGAISNYHVSWTSSSGSGEKTVGGGVRSTSLSGLTNGTTYVVTVTAQNSAGRGPSASSAGVTPSAPKSITISRGTPEAYNDECSLPDCALIRVVAKGFEPGTRVRFVPHANSSYTNEGKTMEIDPDGTESFEAFHFGQVGRTVWVTADGVESNRIVWEEG